MKVITRFAILIMCIAIINVSCSSSAGLMSTLASNPNLSGISSLLKSAGGVSSILGNKGPYTLLAPTNDALSSLGGNMGSVQDLMKPENKSQLTNMLQQYVIPGNVSADDIKAGTVKNAAGTPLNLGTAALGESMKSSDGGVVYVINKLLGQ